MEGNEKIQPHFGDGEFQQLAALLLPLYNSQASTCLACRSVHARHFPVLLCIEQLKLNYFMSLELGPILDLLPSLFESRAEEA